MYSNASKARLLTNLSNATRLEMLSLMTKREVSVGELCSKMTISQSAVSQHLAKLRSEGLVSTRRKSQIVYYTCTNVGVHRVLNLLDEIFSPEFAAKNMYVFKDTTTKVEAKLDSRHLARDR